MDLATTIQHVNWLSVIVAAISSFVVGGIWYGPIFGKAWMTEFNFTLEDLKERKPAKIYSLSLLLAFVAALNLEMFIGHEANWSYGAIAGFLAGFGWVAMFIGIIYLFEMRSLRAFIINAGYALITLTIMGAILGAW